MNHPNNMKYQHPKDIIPSNKEGEPHGYWEVYDYKDNLRERGNFINGEEDGYWEQYYDNGKPMYKGKYVKGEREGHWEWYSKVELFEKTYYII